jgi:hypothetical protein
MLFFLLAALLTAGCLSSIGSTQNYAGYYTHNLNSIPVANSATAVACKNANCACMVCKTGQSFFSFLGLTSLAGGNCFFIGINDSNNQCNTTVLAGLATGTSPLGSNAAVNYFRIGQGPSFADFGAADKYCDNSLGMSVQWLIGAPGSPYSLPSASRAVCMLDKGVIPVYILYSNGTDINITQTMNIATLLGTQGGSVTGGRLPGPVGPVIVTTEINYNASNASLIRQQIEAINAGCNKRSANPPVVNCLVAVAPALGDYAALNAVMEDAPGQLNATMEQDVDLVAYGIDTDTMNLSGQCNNPSAPWQAAEAFSKYSLYNLSKPSIIPYVLFDAAGTDADPNPATQCIWSELTMTSDYAQFFPFYAQAFPGLGIMGVAPYMFNDTVAVADNPFDSSNPLGCKDCSIGADPVRMNSWYSGCQNYINLSRTVTTAVDSYPSYGALLRFPDQASGSCQDDTSNLAALMDNLNYVGGDFTNPQQPQLQPNTTTTLFSCDACVSDTNGTQPFNFSLQSPSPPLRAPSAASLATFCTANPELDYFSGQRSLDPVYVRAVTATESSFSPCAAAVVPSGSACFYSSMTDPSGACSSQIPQLTNGQGFCGLGLMQSLEPPIDYWPDQYQPAGQTGDPAYQAIYNAAVSNGLAHGQPLAANLPLAQACDPTNFNPFNSTDSACVGTAKLAQDMQIAETKVALYHNYRGVNMLNWPSTAVNNDSVFAAYIAANLYVGSWNDNWIIGPTDSYYTSWIVTDRYCIDNPGPPECKDYEPDTANCYGITDPVNFIYCKIHQRPETPGYPSPSLGDVGSIKMWYYYTMKNTSACNSQCPDWLPLYNAAVNVYQKAGKPLPASATITPGEDPDVAG